MNVVSEAQKTNRSSGEDEGAANSEEFFFNLNFFIQPWEFSSLI